LTRRETGVVMSLELDQEYRERGGYLMTSENIVETDVLVPNPEGEKPPPPNTRPPVGGWDN
jgi:hypothetical protein